MASPKAVWTDLILTTQSLIRGLGLLYGAANTSLPDAQVYVQKFPTDRFRMPQNPILFPCIQVCPGPKEDLQIPDDFENLTIVFPVLVVHLFASNQQLALNNDELFWRQAIITKIIDYPRPEVTTAAVVTCEIETHPVLDMQLFEQENLDAGGLMLNFRTTLSRNRP